MPAQRGQHGREQVRAVDQGVRVLLSGDKAWPDNDQPD